MSTTLALAFTLCAAIQVLPSSALQAGSKPAVKPNILYILLDDYGWGNAGWHGVSSELTTPHMNHLLANGVELDRLYTFHHCSPTRASIQTGRDPLHVNTENDRPWIYNPDNNESGFAGIPRSMTGIAHIMRRQGYETHVYGKWDVGMATHEQTPPGRGYDHSLVYAGHGNSYWTYHGFCGKFELSYNGGSPTEFLASIGACQPKCVYEEELFRDRVVEAMAKRRTAKKPFFIFWAPHLVHDPAEVPQAYLDRTEFQDMTDSMRKTLYAMAKYLDDEIGHVVSKLHEFGLYDDTLIIVHSDNGGPIFEDADGNDHAASNWPLRGGKGSNFEGGIRVAGFVSGGHVPLSRRGQKLDSLITAWDWYETLARIAGAASTFDERAHAAHLPPVNSFDMWPVISGAADIGPRTEIYIGDVGANVAGMIHYDSSRGQLFKLLLGKIAQDVLPLETGLPANNRSNDHQKGVARQCSQKPYENACLFILDDDPSESRNVAYKYKGTFAQMKRKIRRYQAHVFNPARGEENNNAACAHQTDFFGPWVFFD